MATVSLYTVGYEGKTPTALVRRLRKNGVTCVADVRYLPLSRRKGFSKSALAERLRKNRIRYISLRALGTPPDMRDEYKKTWDYSWLRKEYRKYLKSHRATLAELYHHASQGDCCLLCFEADAGTCHRSILAGEVMRQNGRGFTVEHL